MKMSDVFELPLQLAVNELAIIDRKDRVVGWADAFSGEPARDCFVEAINNHDIMADEIAELREFVSMVADGDECEESEKLLMAHCFIETAKQLLAKRK